MYHEPAITPPLLVMLLPLHAHSFAALPTISTLATHLKVPAERTSLGVCDANSSLWAKSAWAVFQLSPPVASPPPGQGITTKPLTPALHGSALFSAPNNKLSKHQQCGSDANQQEKDLEA